MVVEFVVSRKDDQCTHLTAVKACRRHQVEPASLLVTTWG